MLRTASPDELIANYSGLYGHDDINTRGVGKTVLLNKIEQIAEEHGYLSSFIEAPEDRKLVELLYPKIHQVLRKLSLVETARTSVHAAMRALRSFAGAFKISVGDFEVSIVFIHLAEGGEVRSFRISL